MFKNIQAYIPPGKLLYKVYRAKLGPFCMFIYSFFLPFSQQMLLTPLLPRPNNRQGRQSTRPHTADILLWKIGRRACFHFSQPSNKTDTVISPIYREQNSGFK